MIFTSAVLCRVELENFERPPRRSWVEARKRWRGFSVWFWHEDRYPHGIKCAKRSEPYNARKLAQIILEQNLVYPMMGERSGPKDSWRAVIVTGEQGINAHILRLAVTYHTHDAQWILEQSKASYDFLDGLVRSAPDADWDDLFSSDVVGNIQGIGCDPDILGLLQHHGFPATRDGIHALAKVLGDECTRLFRLCVAERERRIDRFRPEIDAIAAKYSDRVTKYPYSPRAIIISMLFDYVVEYRRLPHYTERPDGILEFEESFLRFHSPSTPFQLPYSPDRDDL